MGRKKTLLLSLLLTLPVIAFLIHYYSSHSPELQPTGFTVDENVLYMSYAHQYLDQDNFSLFYSNPFDGNPQSPKIYFQPVNFLFAACMKMGADPGLVFSLFGLLMAFCCIYVGVRIVQHLLPGSKYQVLISILFTWGGGLTALAGIGSAVVSGTSTGPWIDSIYLADPANGWWGLNWGRVLFIPLEAWYHFLFLLCILFILRGKWIPAALTGLLLSASHPFTGLEYLIILWEWIAIEKSFFRNKKIPVSFIVISGVTLSLHIIYYLSYLPSFKEHGQLFNQYSVAWTYSFLIFIPAYALVALISFIGMRSKKHFFQLLEFPHQRLFLTWAIIAFLLSKHEWFIKPMQPIHFTRGYVWSGLFLFSLPVLIRLIDYLRKTTLRKIVLAFFVLLFLSDNILWTTNLLRSTHKIEWEGYITKDTREVFAFLNKNAGSNDLVVGNTKLVSYMANVYSSANAWVSHPYNTPNRTERIEIMKKALEQNLKPIEWENRRLIIVIDKRGEQLAIHSLLQTNKVFENSSYVIFIP